MELDFENNRFANGDPTMPLDAKNGRMSLSCDGENEPLTFVTIAMDFFTGKMQLNFHKRIDTDSDKFLTEMDNNYDYYHYIRYGEISKEAKFLVLLDGSVVKCRVPAEDDRRISVIPETFSSKVKLLGWVDFQADIDSDILQKICESNSIDIVITTVTDGKRIIHYHTKELISYARLFYRGLFDSSAYHDEITEKAIKKEKARIEEAERNKNTYKLSDQIKADRAHDKAKSIYGIVLAIFLVLIFILICCYITGNI